MIKKSSIYIWGVLCTVLTARIPLTVNAQEEGASPSMKYHVTNLYPSEDSSDAQCINNKGEIVGTFSKPGVFEERVFLRSVGKNRSHRSLGTLPSKNASSVGGINSLGQVVGSAHNGGNRDESPRIAFIWRNGKMKRLFGDNRISEALAINDKSEITGYMKIRGGREHAFLWRNGTILDIGVLKGGNSVGSAINSIGQVSGYSDYGKGVHAFSWSRGTMLDIGTLGGEASEARGIKDMGQVVGSAETAQGKDHAFVWQKGKMQDLGSPGSGLCAANSINSHGQIVGEWWPEGKDILQSHALVWNKSRLYDLNNLIPKSSGWFLSSARSINDHGQIL